MRDNVLCTFSGGYGDILWSLATVKALSKKHNTPVDMMIMPKYESLVPLLKQQSYIKDAIANHNWICTGQPHGDQPWEAPVPTEIYDQIYHLTYRRHPLPHESLIDFIAAPHLVQHLSPVPFIEVHDPVVPTIPYITYAFNDMYKETKDPIENGIVILARAMGVNVVNTRKLSWVDAAVSIKGAFCFIGCRSSNYVIAHGTGQENIAVYEPHPARCSAGMYGKTFGNPYWPEVTFSIEPSMALIQIAQYVGVLLKNIIKETTYEVSETKPR